MENYIKSAQERAKHFQYALSLYHEYLDHDQKFKNNFLTLLDDLVQTERSSNSRRFFFIAVGKSAKIADLAASMFISVGLSVQFIHPTEALHGDFGMIHKNDSVLFISNSGHSTELLQLVDGLKDRSVTIYTFTSNPNSPIAKKSDFVLQLPLVDEKCPLSQIPLTSTLTSLALCQLLVAATVEKRNLSIESYAKNHPGGTIGKRIFLKVNEIMAHGEQLPVIQSNEKFQKLVSVFTSFAKACLIVIDKNSKFLGLIAERDIRKAMEQYGPLVFERTADEIMNKHAITIKSGSLAIDALKLMTRKKPYLNVLPVISDDEKAVGIIQLQDVFALGL